MKHFSRILALLLAAIFVFSIQPSPSFAQGERQVWAFYLGFWLGGGAWDSQAALLTDRPSLGSYDSRDGGVMGTQIDQAKGAGIDAFIVSWFGVRNGETTSVLNNALDRAGERGFKVAGAVDVFHGFDRAHLEDSIRYLVNDRANHPAYLRYNGRPVIAFAFQNNSGLSNADWLAIRNAIDPDHNTLWLAEGLSGCCLYGGAMDGMYAFNLAWNNGGSGRYSSEARAVTGRGGDLYVATIHPGWDENAIAAAQGRTNPTSPRARNDGQFLRNTFNGATASGANVLMVVSWNEFLENSHIEPSTSYGRQSLDTLGPLIAAWKGNAPAATESTTTESAAPAEPTGRVAEATTTVNVRAGAGTNFNRVGSISPGTRYSVVSESGGWVGINYNGQTAYVSAQYVSISGGSASAPAPAPAGDTAAAPAPAAPTGTVAEATTTVNVRSGAGTNFDRVGRISPGTKYAVVSQSGDWVGINYNGQTAYVSAQYVSISGGSASAAAAPSGAAPAGPATGVTITVQFNSNMRATPSTTAAIVTRIPFNATVSIVGRNGDSSWLQVTYEGASGWIASTLGNISGDLATVPVTQ